MLVNNSAQIRGLIAIFLILAVIPFISFFWGSLLSHKTPPFTLQTTGSAAIAIVDDSREKGIYFVSPSITANQFFKITNLKARAANDFPLLSGMKINMISTSLDKKIVVSEMPAAQRLALALPIDLNSASEDDFMLIPGIGEKTAQKILIFRRSMGHFRKLEQLMEIDGIKERKFVKFKQYFYLRNK